MQFMFVMVNSIYFARLEDYKTETKLHKFSAVFRKLYNMRKHRYYNVII